MGETEEGRGMKEGIQGKRAMTQRIREEEEEEEEGNRDIDQTES